MAFQGSITEGNIAFGIAGELHNDSPHRAQPGWLESASAANNVFGRAFTVKEDATGNQVNGDDPKPLVVQAGGAATNAFAGILANPKEHVSYGTAAGGGLAPTMILPNGRIAAFVTSGQIIVPVSAAVTIGMVGEFVNATGVLNFRAESGTVPAGSTRIVGSTIVRYEAGPTGLAVLDLDGDLSLVAGA